mmetsp:Transcript_42123/g.61972  ORF Transcript_42123/g.61972 Transcript_42123/m.61972 type:complete len:90 (-) Transcript_42123:179-448(-)
MALFLCLPPPSSPVLAIVEGGRRSITAQQQQQKNGAVVSVAQRRIIMIMPVGGFIQLSRLALTPPHEFEIVIATQYCCLPAYPPKKLVC